MASRDHRVKAGVAILNYIEPELQIPFFSQAAVIYFVKTQRSEKLDLSGLTTPAPLPQPTANKHCTLECGKLGIFTQTQHAILLLLS